MSELKDAFDDSNAGKKDSGKITPEAQKQADPVQPDNKRGEYLWLRTPHPSSKTP